MENFVADAKAKGAKVLAGRQRIGNSGYFFPRTVLADVPDDARAMRDEPFGPLALISPVRSLDEATRKPTRCPMAWPPMLSPGRLAIPTIWPTRWKGISRSITSWLRSPKSRSAA